MNAITFSNDTKPGISEEEGAKIKHNKIAKKKARFIAIQKEQKRVWKITPSDWQYLCTEAQSNSMIYGFDATEEIKQQEAGAGAKDDQVNELQKL